ncbi:MAG: hypothetical protein R3C03_05855 [Pirellulaceae bacterium]
MAWHRIVFTETEDNPMACAMRQMHFRFSAVIFLIVLGTFVARDSNAQEPAEAFLRALRERGLFELANDYLLEAANDPLVDSAFRERVPLEHAENMIQFAESTRTFIQKTERLVEAEQVLEKFMASGASGDMRQAALSTLGNLRLQQGLTHIIQSQSDRATEEERNELLDLARDSLGQSVAAYAEVRESLKKELESAGKDLTPDIKRKYQLFQEVRLRFPFAQENEADTYPEGDPRRAQLLTAAADEYQQLWKAYSGYSSGVNACLQGARALNKLGRHQEALDLMKDLYERAGSENTRALAAIQAIDAWEGFDPYPFDEVIFFLEPLAANLTNSQMREDKWGTIQIGLAKAYWAKFEKAKADGDAALMGRAKKTAARLIKRASRSRGNSQEIARQLIEQWGVSTIEMDDADADAEVVSFPDAKLRIDDQIVQLDETYRGLLDAKSQLANATGDSKTDLEQSVSEMASEISKRGNEIILMIDDALKLPLDDVQPNDLNHLKYLRAYVYFTTGRYFHTVALGQFALDRISGLEWSRQTAGLATKSLAVMYENNPDGNRDFEKTTLIDFCERIYDRWPGTPEAQQSAAILVQIALADGNTDLAEKYKGGMSAGGGASLTLARQKWLDFKARKREMSSEQMDAQSEALREEANKIIAELESGLKGFSPENVNFEAAYSALLLANARLEVGETAKAVEQLESAIIAPLDLVKQKHPAVMQSSNAVPFMIETFRTAINAYLSSLRTSDDPAPWITKTRGVLDALQVLLKEHNPDTASREMLATYAKVSSELTEQFASIDDPNEKSKLASNLSEFLVSMASESNDINVVRWVGVTLNDVAQTMRTNEQTKAAAREIFGKAVEVLSRGETFDLSQVENGALLSLLVRRAKANALAGKGSYQEAIDVIAELIGERNALDLQIDGARIFQEWGHNGGGLKAFESAVAGGGPEVVDSKTRRKSNSIWGWRKLVTATVSKTDNADSFHESNLGFMNSQYEYAQLKGVDAKAALVSQYERTEAKFPDFGGAKYKSRYEELKKKIDAL